MEVKGRWDKMQHEFNKGSLLQNNQITDILCKENPIDLIYMDLSKVFNMAPGRKLLI